MNYREKRHEYRRALIPVLSPILLGLLLTGCGKTGSDAAEGNSANADAQVSSSAMDTSAASMSDSEDLEADTGESESDPETIEEFSYAELDGYEFCFASGAGGWGTVLTVGADGSFSGYYHDSEMGSVDEENYPYGSYYYCDFEGKFSEPVKENEYTYTLQIEEISYENEPDTEEILDGVRYCYTLPYGLDGATKVQLYLPGTPLTVLSEEVISWLEGATILEGSRLTFYVLVSLPEEQAFSSTYYGAETGEVEHWDDMEANDIFIENPSWDYYLSDLAVTKSLPGYTLEKLSEESNEITDVDAWFAENGLTKPGQSYTKDYCSYAISGGFGTTPYVSVTDLMTATTIGYDLSAYAVAATYKEEDAPYVEEHVFYAEAENGILYVATGHSTYAESCPQTAYITAIDMHRDTVLWKTAPLTCNSSSFAIVDDYIVCGYGFTAEDDYLKVVRKDNGVVQEEVLLKSAPKYIFLKDGILYVRCYDTNYTFRMSMG